MSFSDDLKEFSVEVENTHTENVEAVEDFTYNFVVSKSPRKSGAFQANHNRTLDGPDYSFDKSKTAGSAPQPTGGRAPVFYIANGAPYAGRLENGWSQQAPHGVYGRAVASAKGKFGI